MNFPPPFDQVKSHFTVSSVNGELMVNASYTQFAAMIRELLEYVRVDEEWYINQYPGIREGIRDGVCKSARDHFIHNGYFEGRLPHLIKVDEHYYLEQNPGIAEAVRLGRVKSAQHHFIENGYREGRRPFPDPA